MKHHKCLNRKEGTVAPKGGGWASIFSERSILYQTHQYCRDKANNRSTGKDMRGQCWRRRREKRCTLNPFNRGERHGRRSKYNWRKKSSTSAQSRDRGVPASSKGDRKDPRKKEKRRVPRKEVRLVMRAWGWGGKDKSLG